MYCGDNDGGGGLILYRSALSISCTYIHTYKIIYVYRCICIYIYTHTHSLSHSPLNALLSLYSGVIASLPTRDQLVAAKRAVLHFLTNSYVFEDALLLPVLFAAAGT